MKPSIAGMMAETWARKPPDVTLPDGTGIVLRYWGYGAYDALVRPVNRTGWCTARIRVGFRARQLAIRDAKESYVRYRKEYP